MEKYTVKIIAKLSCLDIMHDDEYHQQSNVERPILTSINGCLVTLANVKVEKAD